MLRGSTSRIVSFAIRDTRSNTTARLAGLVFNSAGLTATYQADNAASPTTISLVTMTAGTWASGGFIESSEAGRYQFGIPNAVLASGKSVLILLSGAANMAEVEIPIELQADFVREGTAQGGSSTTITLDAGASSVDQWYKGQTVRLTSGTGAPQSRMIVSYVGATKVATVRSWTAPDSTTTFEIHFSAGVNTIMWDGVLLPTAVQAGYPTVVMKVGTGAGEINAASGKVPATIATGDITDISAARAAKIDTTETRVLLALPAVAPGASGGLHYNGSNAGTTTFAALTVTGAYTLGSLAVGADASADAILVTGKTTFTASAMSPTVAVIATNSGQFALSVTATNPGLTGGALYIVGGAGGEGNGIYCVAAGAHGSGIYAASDGTGDEDSGIYASGRGALGSGFYGEGKHAGHGAWLQSEGAGSGMLACSLGAGDGIKTSVTTGTGFRGGLIGSITGDLSGSVGSIGTGGIATASFAAGATVPRVTLVDTVTALTGNTAQTGDAFARLGAPAGASVSADIVALKTDTGTLVTRIPAALFAGITSIAQWLGLIAGKQTGNTTARTELRATGAASGRYDETTDSLEAVRDRGDVSWAGGVTITPLVAQTSPADPIPKRIEVSQGSAPTMIFDCVDATGAEVNLSGLTVRFVAGTDDGITQAALFSYVTGSGITLSIPPGGSLTSRATVQFSTTDTATARTLKWWLWNISGNKILGKGTLDIPAALKVVV